LLEREGVRFDRNGRTDWKRFGWDGSGVAHGIREDEWLDTVVATETKVKKRSARNVAAQESPTAPARRTRSKRAAGTRR
jgi:hypothetical protein